MTYLWRSGEIDLSHHVWKIKVPQGFANITTMTSCMPQRGEASQIGRDEARHGKGFQGLLDRYFGK